jgi:hypothetical protein
MPLNQEQITGLNAANDRITSGVGKDLAGDRKNLDYAAKTFGYKAPVKPAVVAGGAQVKTDPNALANAVDQSGKTPFELGTGIEGYDAALAKQNAPAPVDPNAWMGDWMKSAFGVNADGTPKTADTIKAPTFEAEKARLQEARNNRTAALDATYATDLARLQKNNGNAGNALKARLLKLGVSPTDSAWSNAEAGQLERDTASESALRSEYMSNKAKIESDSDTALTNVAMNEATMAFNANVKNIENKLQTQAQGINLYQIFSQRDQSEKDREQKAYGDMLQYQGTMATLDQRQQEAISKNFIENAQKGLYNISDKGTLEMLSKLEKESPYLTGLTQIASSGLSDRLDKKAQDKMNLEKTSWDIKNIKSTIADRGKNNTGTKEATKIKLLNEYAGYIDQQVHTTTDASGNQMTSKTARPLTLAEYQTARQGAILAGLDAAAFDETFQSSVDSKQRYTTTNAADSGSYLDNVTGKVIPIKSTY